MLTRSRCSHLVLTIALVVPSFLFAFSGGDGSADNPFQITTAAHLNDVRLYCGIADSGKYFKLMNDIDLTTYLSSGNPGYNEGAFWLPIGLTDMFYGKFDGNSYKITGLKINRPDNDTIGLFGCIYTNAKIENVTIEMKDGDTIKGEDFVGGLVGMSGGTINNCNVTGTIYGLLEIVGGVIGYNWKGTINQCYFAGNVHGFHEVGGLIGQNNMGTVSNCNATGSIIGKNVAGGLIGFNSSGTVNTCFSEGVVGDSTVVGGLIGENVGGLISNSYSTCEVSGNGYHIARIGGFVGWNIEPGIISNSYATGIVNSSGSMPGYIGGFAGKNDGIINNSYATGSVTGNFGIGGFVGVGTGRIENCCAFGTVSGTQFVGGLCGGDLSGSGNGYISNSYAFGMVGGIQYVGGLLGTNSDTVNTCYATGLVKGTTYVGGLAGRNNGVIDISYWDKQTTNQISSDGSDPSFGKTTAEMTSSSTFIGWNFTDVWNVELNKNYGYPYLQWQTVFIPSPPRPLAPSDKSVDVPITPDLVWCKYDDDLNYTVQVSLTSNFSSLVINSSHSDTVFSIDSGILSNNTTYYWRVAATKNSGEVTNFSTVFSFTTIPGVPAAPILFTPSDGATGLSVIQALKWNPVQSATTYRVQFSTSSDFSGVIFDDSTVAGTAPYGCGELSGNTTYYWRVNAKNAIGTSEWSDVWSFTTAIESPERPTLASPVNSSPNQPLSTSLAWNASTGASTYRVQLSTSSNFSSIIIDDSTITSLTKTTGLLSTNTTYYWRVNAKNAGGTSEWSDIWSFSTTSPTAGVPVLSSPLNSTTDQSLNLTLSWNASTGASTYRVQLSTSSNFSSTIVDDPTITSLSKAIGPLSTNTIYYWRVNAKNAGGTSEWSEVWSFSTIPPTAGVPVPSSPPNSATDQSLNLSLSWGTVAEASTYRVQLSTSSNFSSTIIDDSTITSLSKTIESLNTNTTYYWRVNAKNVGGTSEWSEVWSFSTIPPTAGVPVPSSPLNSATDQSLNLTLSWNAATGASIYRVQLSTAGNFSSTIIDDSTVTSLSKTIEALNTNTTYYWRVNAKNAGGTSEWTEVWSFTTLPPPPKPIILISPLKKAINVTLDVHLNWQKSSDATKYYLQISTDSIFSSIVWLDSTLEDTNTTCDKLTNDAIYFWRVKAYNQGGTGEWSPFFQFTTIVSLPSLSTLLSPISRDSVGTDSVNLIWYSGTPDIDKYLVEYSNDSLFSNSNKDSTVTDTIKAITNLEKNQIVYWHVKAHNVAGWGDWSNTSWFIVNIPPVNTVQKIPKVFSFSVNNRNKHFKYTLPQAENVSLLLYDLKGVLRAEIVNERQNAGFYTVSLPLHGLASGTYITVFNAGKFVSKKRSFYIR